MPITKTFEVVFYKSSAGNEPVREWLLGLDKDDKKIIGTDIKLIELSGGIETATSQKDRYTKQTLGSKKSSCK